MINEQQLTSALSAVSPILLSSSASAGGRTEATAAVPPADPWSDCWPLPGGTAWVYYGQGNQGLTRPVLLADGFGAGASDIDELYDGLERHAFPLVSALRRRGRDVVVIGYDDRGASILDNAHTATAAIHRAAAERLGGARLLAGGFSMGGLVTRYALARMEQQRVDHQVGVYFSWDSPHRGAYVPISLQAFAHYLRAYDARFSDQFNSPAARELLSWHLSDWTGVPGVDPLRTRFLQALESVGGWPRLPRLLAVADGTGDGSGNGVEAGEAALLGTGDLIAGTELRTQPIAPDTLVAKLRVLTPDVAEVQAPGVPPVDGAPGGTLPGFAILADALNAIAEATGLGLDVDNPDPAHCFVPSISAVSVRDLTEADLHLDIDALDPDESDFDDFLCAGTNHGHTEITEEAATWLLDRLPD
ncbi:hypothetical protein MF672_016655 [Actinomadura sp. ATCC 31491]|uniref:Alpha/beta hydrolase n=1 Tax=Actinomadura luzonensis TaxID=2805427 RepID=A0ABT0FSW5_9ACTN|nr:hypothetical protein [Actinomadura luzonensis]MCK2215407.1 hypothetical protein [Actinomadura luzonensis]